MGMFCILEQKCTTLEDYIVYQIYGYSISPCYVHKKCQNLIMFSYNVDFIHYMKMPSMETRLNKIVYTFGFMLWGRF